jgi:hypothetical protein
VTEDFSDCGWLYWCPELSVDRWRRERREVEARFSLFRFFAEPLFFGFRGVVARSGFAYNVTVAAEMDMYPALQPWVFVTPPVAGANTDGKLRIDASWRPATSTFADVIEAVITHVETASRT